MASQQSANKHIHLIGVGGAGLSAIAHLLLARGFKVTGSDMNKNEQTHRLEKAGAVIFEGHSPEQIVGAQMIVRSSAIPDNNVEIQAAQAANIRVLKRADFLGSLMAETIGIAVAGSHGKTTTTGMIGHILMKCRLDPNIVVGGFLPLIQANGRAGKGHHFVIEADEYDHMFLGLRPKVIVVTNIEHDHPDIFPTPESYYEAFRNFALKLPPKGKLVVCGEDPIASELLKIGGTEQQRIVYSIKEPVYKPKNASFVRARNISQNQHGGHDFQVELNGKIIGPARLRIPGEHNILNSLAAIATVLFEGIGYKHISHALSSFTGMGRRFEIKGQINGITIIDDYAHHPTEIRATLGAARQRFLDHRVWAVWQPHTFSRLKLLKSSFATCFEDADHVIVLDVYRSRESDTLGLTVEEIASELVHGHVEVIPTLVKAMTHLLEHARPGDVIITLNAGDARVLGDWILDGLREKQAQSYVTASGSLKDKSSNPKPKSAEQDRKATVDATAEQVRRLVEKLKDQPQE